MRAISATYVPKTYADLLRCVQQTMFVGQREIDEAWVRTFHETGRLIVSHILLDKRADYGAQVYRGLARDTAASERKLYECAQFYRSFPILRRGAKLNWAHYRVLCQVENETQRLALLKDAMKEGWTSPELITRVRALNASASAAETLAQRGDAALAGVELLTPRRGTPGLHPIVDRGDGPVVDLGFKLYRELGGASKLTTTDIVRLSDDGVRRVEGATRAELFTYTATVRRVVDGDTLLVALEVAPGITLEKLLRLRGVDCPEMSTAAGRAAKAFGETLVSVGDEVLLSTTKPDKYDRSLAEVFLRPAVSDKLKTKNSEPAPEIFLNNALLQNGHAVRYDGGPKDE